MKSTPSTTDAPGHARQANPGKSRRYRRFPVDARIAIFRAGQRRPYHGRTLGISEAGISALLAADMEASESVSLEFSLPGDSKPLAVRAIIRNRNGARYGFEFLTLSEQQRAAITSFCESQSE